MMMYEFLNNNRDELEARCREKVAKRPSRSATDEQLQNGVPLFLDQLIRTLHIEQSSAPMDSLRISGPAGGALAASEVGASAARHGKDLLDLGFTVDEVVHDYGDLCQAITDLAVERDAPFLVDEFRTLNRCLDNAIADAVSEFGYQRESVTADRLAKEANERAGWFAHELRNFLGTASLAFTAAKAGNLSLSGATGSILERSLTNLSRLIENSLVDIRAIGQPADILNSFSLSGFIAEVASAAELAATAKGCSLVVPPVDAELAICGNRELLLSATANLLQNAIKFTHINTEVKLSAFASAERILIEVSDHCGGLPPNAAETMFLPFSQGGADRSGIGLGLTIAQQSVIANNGILTVRDTGPIGCIFTISLPRFSILT